MTPSKQQSITYGFGEKQQGAGGQYTSENAWFSFTSDVQEGEPFDQAVARVVTAVHKALEQAAQMRERHALSASAGGNLRPGVEADYRPSRGNSDPMLEAFVGSALQRDFLAQYTKQHKKTLTDVWWGKICQWNKNKTVGEVVGEIDKSIARMSSN